MMIGTTERESQQRITTVSLPNYMKPGVTTPEKLKDQDLSEVTDTSKYADPLKSRMTGRLGLVRRGKRNTSGNKPRI